MLRHACIFMHDGYVHAGACVRRCIHTVGSACVGVRPFRVSQAYMMLAYMVHTSAAGMHLFAGMHQQVRDDAWK